MELALEGKHPFHWLSGVGSLRVQKGEVLKLKLKLKFWHVGFLAVWPSMVIAEPAGPWVRHTIDASSQGADGVRLADVNGDGHMDVTTAWEEGGLVRVYLHPGKQRVREAWPQVTVGEVASGEDAVFVDLDGDGAMDVVSSCEGKTRRLHVHWAPREAERYLEASAWETAVIPATDGRMAWMYAMPMDVDRLNGIDLVVAGKGNGAKIGWLRAPKDPRDLSAWDFVPIRPMGWVMSITHEDMDGDGDMDVLYSDRRGDTRGLHWLELSEKGEWRHHGLADSDRENMFLGAGDLDRDGRRDLVCAVSGGPIMWYRRSENAWSSHVIPLPEGVGTGKSAAMGDIDGDGDTDVVFSCENAHGARSGLRWMSWVESPASKIWRSHEIAGAEGLKYDRVELIDLDGDGDLDVLTCEERDQLGVIWYENPHG